jgi:hypothetical protein
MFVEDSIGWVQLVIFIFCSPNLGLHRIQCIILFLIQHPILDLLSHGHLIPSRPIWSCRWQPLLLPLVLIPCSTNTRIPIFLILSSILSGTRPPAACLPALAPYVSVQMLRSPILQRQFNRPLLPSLLFDTLDHILNEFSLVSRADILRNCGLFLKCDRQKLF